MRQNRKRKLNVYSPIVEHSYMVSLKNSKEFLAVLRRYGRLFSRFLYTGSQVSMRLQLLTKFGMMLLRMQKTSGSEYVVKYLKACTVALQRFLGGKPLKTMREIEPDLPLPGLTSRGLPKFIPTRDRRELGKLTVSVVRWYLTIFSVYRIISCPPKLKLNTITDPFTGSTEVLESVCTWLLANSKRLVSKMTRVSKLPSSLGLERIQKASPTSKISWKGCIEDAAKWHGRSEFYDYACYSGSFSLYYDWYCLWKEYIFDRKKINAPVDMVPRPDNTWSDERATLAMIKDTVSLGSLSFKEEAAGKVRVFAMVDIWSQSILKPLHDALFRMFRAIPNDSTHNQDAGFQRAKEKAINRNSAFCYDLSAATDRLPISLQVAILNSLWGREPSEDNVSVGSFGEAWAALLTKRQYFIPARPLYGRPASDSITYAVGQPMGALSSWAMLNLTHHLILQYLNIVVLKRPYLWHENYEVLGDDIVIFDSLLADEYFKLMELGLGVKCNSSKSLLAPERPVIEFAKRVSIGANEVSGFSWRQARSLDSLFGRAAMAFDLLSRKIQKSPLRVLKALTGRQWSNVDSYLYSLLFIASNLVKRGVLPLQLLSDYLIDPKNPFRFIGGRVIGNLQPGPLEDLIVKWCLGKPVTLPKVDPQAIAWYSRLFDAYARGYLTDRIAELILEMTRKGYLDDCMSECGRKWGPPLPNDAIDMLFYWEKYKVMPKWGAFEHLPISDLLEMYDRFMQMKRDFQFYKFNVERKPKLDNALKLLSFIERSKKAGIISIEIKR